MEASARKLQGEAQKLRAKAILDLVLHLAFSAAMLCMTSLCMGITILCQLAPPR